MLRIITLLLCLVESLERFANYFLIPNLAATVAVNEGISRDIAIATYYGYYSAASYLFNPIGALLGEKTNYKRVAQLGLFLLGIGYFAFYLYAKSFGSYLLLPALAILATGHGCFKPNMVALVKRTGESFGLSNDDQGALLKKFYFSINIGGMISGLGIIFLLPRIGFLPCVVAILLSNLLLFLILRKIPKYNEELMITNMLRGVGTEIDVKSRPTSEILLFILFGFLFWISNLQMNTTIYTLSSKWIPGYEEAFTSVNSVLVSLVIFFRLGPQKENRQLKLSLYLAAIAFLALALNLNMFGIIFWYVLIAFAEVFISPVGQNYILTFAKKHKNVLLGVWFLGISLANKIAAQLTTITHSVGYKTIFAVNGLLLLVAAPIFIKKFTTPDENWIREIKISMRAMVFTIKLFPAKIQKHYLECYNVEYK